MNCILIDPDTNSRVLLSQLISDLGPFNILETFPDCKSAQEDVQDADVIFIDVKLLQGSCEELINNFRKKGSKVVITGEKREEAVLGFNLRADDFLLKPVDAIRLAKTFTRLQKENDLRKEKSDRKINTLFIREEKSWVHVPLQKIYYIHSKGPVVEIKAESKTYTLKSKLNKLHEQLPEDDFMRVNKFFIIRLDKIEAIEQGGIVVAAKSIPLLPNQQEKLMSQLKLI